MATGGAGSDTQATIGTNCGLPPTAIVTGANERQVAQLRSEPGTPWSFPRCE